MREFEWDDNKNRSNKKKHGVTFEQGSGVFDDEHRQQRINVRDGERRYLTIGKVFKVILTVVYTMRDLTFRLISVRRAHRDERNNYLRNRLQKFTDDNDPT